MKSLRPFWRRRLVVLPASALALVAGVACGIAPSGSRTEPAERAGVTRTALAGSGIWTPLVNPPPLPISVDLLLTDGTVIGHPGPPSTQWLRLRPDATGSYVNGTWVPIASSHDSRYAYASAVMRDGRAFMAGGEYGSGDTTVELYDPRLDSWRAVPPPLFLGQPTDIGDAYGVTMPDGRILLFPRHETDARIYDPLADSWTTTAGKLAQDQNDEESVVKLPDGTFLVADVQRTRNDPQTTQYAEKYVPSIDQWVTAGIVPVLLVDAYSEIGAGVMLDDGRVFFLGATSNTAFYSPPAYPTQPGTWQAGPVVPDGNGAGDVPVAVLPSGDVLVETVHIGPGGAPELLEYNPTSNVFLTEPRPFADPNAVIARMLVLPTGQVLASDGGGHFAVYTPPGVADPGSKPAITSIADNGDGRFLVSGTGLNGKNEGASFGDDAQMATNFALVRLTSATGTVRYARTYGFSSMGVGTAAGSFWFAVPGTSAGTYSLSVVVNGVESNPFSLPISAAAAQCNDGVRNATETDVDCGGQCGPCALGQACAAATDCSDATCAGGVCTLTCYDGAKDATETDVDCGGHCTRTCAVGQGCSTAAHCGGLPCVSGVCAPYCHDSRYCSNGSLAVWMLPAVSML